MPAPDRVSETGLLAQCPKCFRPRWAHAACRCQLPEGDLPVAEEIPEPPEQPMKKSKKYRPN